MFGPQTKPARATATWEATAPTPPKRSMKSKNIASGLGPTRNRPLRPRASISLTSCFDNEALYDLCELKGLSRPGFVQGYDPTQEPLPRREPWPARAFNSSLGFPEKGPNEDPGTASRLLPRNLHDQQRLQSRRSCELQVGFRDLAQGKGKWTASWSSSMPSLLTLS